MEVSATVTSKGQVTIPKQVREALGISAGDRVLFRVEGGRATLARTRELLDLAGSVSVPAAKRGASWDDIRSATRSARSGPAAGGGPPSRGRRAG
ncbi:MAG TPA: AbrB/MazE/SpoVT family DNA-binding domain-containing protein [Mycobacteriales bacterium]|nr:AbrB/MazE/SpoVT family DNA-binding domain-containing protein [Mycobacteriales bacterium]